MRSQRSSRITPTWLRSTTPITISAAFIKRLGSPPRWKLDSRITRDHMSLFLRKCSSTRKESLASSLLLPLRQHTPSEAPKPCVRAETCSFLRDRRPTHPRICRRLVFLLVCPNHGSAFLQNVKISSRLARLHRVRRSRIYFFACARNSADHAFVR
jgi:hypothetical protein